MANPFSYEGKRVVVTGAATGVGAPLIELSGAALVAEPLRWRPLRDSGLPRWRCRCALARPLPVDDAFSLRVIGCPLLATTSGAVRQYDSR